MPVDVRELTIGVLGGTGPLGGGLARRFAAAGVTVLVGSRDAARGRRVAEEIRADVPGGSVTGGDNAETARQSDILVVAVPYEGHADLLKSLADVLAGKIVVDAVNPLAFDKQGAYALEVAEGSAAQQAAALLPDSRVTAAFHHVSAPLLLDREVPRVELDVLVLGDDREATDAVQALAELIPGARGVYGGRLRNARQVEALTANIISINRRYKAHAGVRITDV
ncbi:MAG TPA: NADPH-dependent F420 reductase [Mycobacteriales bacterium]|nr:NADPH-dependent F420 reductase [Mycobacteriales bacterium]